MASPSSSAGWKTYAFAGGCALTIAGGIGTLIAGGFTHQVAMLYAGGGAIGGSVGAIALKLLICDGCCRSNCCDEDELSHSSALMYS